MNKQLDQKWNAAALTGVPVKIGDLVACDVCGNDYTHSKAEGGFLFITKAYCPKCAAHSLHRIKEYGEEHLIRERARPGESFRDFVLRLRGQDATVQIITSERHEGN